MGLGKYADPRVWQRHVDERRELVEDRLETCQLTLIYAETMSGFWIAALLAPAALRDSELAPEPLTAPPIAAADTEAAAPEIDRVCDEPSCQPRDWHIGLNLRTDFGTHPLRIDGGVRFDRFDVILVLDPMFWLDGQSDNDLLLDVGIAGRMVGVRRLASVVDRHRRRPTMATEVALGCGRAFAEPALGSPARPVGARARGVVGETRRRARDRYDLLRQPARTTSTTSTSACSCASNMRRRFER